MDKKSKSLYEAKENQIMDQSASFVEFLTKMGVLEDCQIDDALVRKAKKSTAQKAFHNTKVLLEHFRTICWVLESVPGELAAELNVPTKNLDILAAKIDLQTTLENKKLENRLNAAMKTRILVGRVRHSTLIYCVGSYQSIEAHTSLLLWEVWAFSMLDVQILFLAGKADNSYSDSSMIPK